MCCQQMCCQQMLNKSLARFLGLQYRLYIWKVLTRLGDRSWDLSIEAPDLRLISADDIGLRVGVSEAFEDERRVADTIRGIVVIVRAVIHQHKQSPGLMLCAYHAVVIVVPLNGYI
jgi:hypothetical protein